MKIFNNYILASILLILTISCSKDAELVKQTYKINYNILLVPDLSNRINHSIHPKPLHDTVILNTVLDSIPRLLKISNRNLNQLDTYKIDFINRGILNDEAFNGSIFGISFLQFKNKLIDASDFKRNRLKLDISKLKEETAKVYTYAQSHSSGSDVWNYFNETVHSSLLYDVDTLQNPKKNSLVYKTKNIVVLLTDGYIETINKTAGYSFNQDMVTDIRNQFLKSKSDDLKKFILSNPRFLIKKMNNDLKNTDILILEVTDRSLDTNGVARYHPTDLEIIKIIWTDWLTKSGAERVQIHSALSNRKDVYITLKNFIEHK